MEAASAEAKPKDICGIAEAEACWRRSVPGNAELGEATRRYERAAEVG
jgi:hypothetical protein